MSNNAQYDDLVLHNSSVCSVCHLRLRPLSERNPAKDQTRVDRVGRDGEAKISEISRETIKAARTKPLWDDANTTYDSEEGVRCANCETLVTVRRPRRSPAPAWQVTERAERLCDSLASIGVDVDRDTLLSAIADLKGNKHCQDDVVIYRRAVERSINAQPEPGDDGLRPSWLVRPASSGDHRRRSRTTDPTADTVTWGPYRWGPVNDP